MSLMYYFIFFTAAILLGFYLYYFFLNKSSKYNIRKANTQAIRWSSQTKPIFGGIGFYLIFLFTIICYYFFFGKDGLIEKDLIVIFLIVTMAFLMGLADDIISTSPFFKFVIQLGCSLLLIFFDIYINISPLNYINYIVTVLWVVGIMNSFNMLDNMDAITTSVSLTIFSGLLTISLFVHHSNHFYIFLNIGIIAALLSFLSYNWHPAKMYMGDNGSQFLGAMLALLGIIFLWNGNKGEGYFNNTKQLMAVVLAFMVPIIDTTCVTINRISRGKSPFVGGRDHTTHHLSYLGLHERSIAFVLAGLNLISVIISVYITLFLDEWKMSYFYLTALYFVTFFLILFIITKKTKPAVKNV